MRKHFSVLTSLWLLPLLAAPIALAQIYVSPHGDDAHNGTAARPVRTLPRALALSHTTNDRRIILSGGTYRLTEPLHLTPADSGTQGHDLVFAAAPGEQPTLSGAVRIVHWRLLDPSRNLWSAAVPDSVTNSRQLYINGFRATRTRARVPVALTETPTGYVAAGDAMASWKNPSDIEFVYTGGNSVWSEHSEGLGSWDEPRCPIASINGNAITMAQPCWTTPLSASCFPAASARRISSAP